MPHDHEASSSLPSSLPISLAFSSNSLWDDGLAEVATYSSVRPIYGAPRHYDLTMITVKEDFNRAYNVKTDDYDRTDLFTVLKVNLFTRIPTDNYPYHFLTSVFVPRDNIALVHKITSSSQEWCGTTFKHISRVGSGVNYSWDSYWDGEGVGRMTLDSSAYFEDQLFVTLRALQFREGLEASFTLYPSTMTSRARLLPSREATLRVVSDVIPDLQHGTNQSVWHVTVTQSEGPTLNYWYGKDFPHVLYRFASSDGRSMVLSNVQRVAYWQQ